MSKPTVTVEMIEVESPTAIIGKVLWEHSFYMLLDANGYVPNVGDEVKPPGVRKLYDAVAVRREYLKKGIKIKVLVQPKQGRRKKK